jgi:ABC-type multidrug transport system fused ATPase/permease subunit
MTSVCAMHCTTLMMLASMQRYYLRTHNTLYDNHLSSTPVQLAYALHRVCRCCCNRDQWDTTCTNGHHTFSSLVATAATAAAFATTTAADIDTASATIIQQMLILLLLLLLLLLLISILLLLALLLLLLLLQELNVTEHVDPSLFVIEPCCGVAGLEVLDAHTQQWLQAEAVCAPGKDLILFGGKALEVRTSKLAAHCKLTDESS